MQQLGREPGVPGLAGHRHGHHGPGVLRHGDLDIEHEAALLGVGHTGHRPGEGTVPAPAWLQGPGLGSGRGGGGQELQQEVGVGPHLGTGHLPQVLRDVVIRDLREVGGHVWQPEGLAALNQAKLGQLSLCLKMSNLSCISWLYTYAAPALTCLVAASDFLFLGTFENNFDRSLLGIKGTPYSFMGQELSSESLDTFVFSDDDAFVTKVAKIFGWHGEAVSL